MPYPRYGGSGQDGENNRRGRVFPGTPNPWQGAELNTGLTNVNPMALVGNLVGAMVGQMAGGGGGLGSLMALQGGHQNQRQSESGDGWLHGNADRGVRQVQVANPFLTPVLSFVCVSGERKGETEVNREMFLSEDEFQF